MPRVVKRPLAETYLDDIWWYIPRTIQAPPTGSSIRYREAGKLSLRFLEERKR